ncbi:hypothetical protein PHLGIDRAFT_61458 [Phlebiopsis gigantea 11061_1 CR5-6]|uniref:GTP cyclohydrolase II n=1 Tax=Phlebiopsis gigantea (strain 11061_1 CR5-6) TaxID=745531 RepID=A0A0C3SEI0_PHLG1|nr:hypothetical protein PHLGIDRAFT_61458 [Phlebiopsis gigantea 11061_1 CR5-6]
MSDLALLDFLTSPDLPVAKHGLKRRDADLDPLMLAAVYSSGPQVTRNHYAHDFFPAVGDPRAEGAYDWTKWQAEPAKPAGQRRPRLKYVSRQEPRSQRLRRQDTETPKSSPPERSPSSSHTLPPSISRTPAHAFPSSDKSAPLEVKCMARTRVPTPHGPVFLHLYHNNHDSKEHLAIVVDPAQFAEPSQPRPAPPIRSRTLDAVWSDAETDMDRITRGAYVGRLSQTSQTPSTPSSSQHPAAAAAAAVPPPLIRVHSECFTGETIGSMRCDCGEQLDEALRQIAQPGAAAAAAARGAVVYLRQEGRGIGLLSKLRAYNLQDLGHDTVTANLLLGHGADERGYAVAAAILRDLGLGGAREPVRVLTNNPDKMAALAAEGIRVVERVPMVPRSWACRQPDAADGAWAKTSAGATMIGGGVVYGADLDKYLRTKVLRMGHMLPLIATGEEDDDP